MTAGSGAEIHDENENIYLSPPDDELIPPASKETQAAHAVLPASDPSWNTEKEGNPNWACPNPNTPESEGDTLSGAESQRVKTVDAKEVEKEDRAVSDRRFVGFQNADVLVTKTRGGLRKVGQGPYRFWPAYPPTSPCENRTTLLGILSLRRGTTVRCRRNMGGSIEPTSSPRRRR